jgi:CheY-like chemotaxis protein
MAAILVVDDNAQVRTLIRTGFGRAGHDIYDASTIRQALLNDRPRKIMNWDSPAHAFHQLLHEDFECTLTPFILQD